MPILDSFSIRTTALVLVLLSSASSAAAQALPSGAAPAGFHLLEATIEDIHGAFQSKRITCRELVDLYIKRIEAYDKEELPPIHGRTARGSDIDLFRRTDSIGYPRRTRFRFDPFDL